MDHKKRKRDEEDNSYDAIQQRANGGVNVKDEESLAKYQRLALGSFKAESKVAAPSASPKVVLHEVPRKGAFMSEISSLAKNQPSNLPSKPPSKYYRMTANKTKEIKFDAEELKALDEYKMLSDEQRVIFDVLLKKQSMFITGNAGTGKSYSVHAFVQACRKLKIAVAITASTGIAASVYDGGSTLHSYMGIGRSKAMLEHMKACTKIPSRARVKFPDTQVLIIDEISMVSDGMLEALDNSARVVRGNDLPFGGILVVAVGDFAQLAPVEPGSAKIPFVFLHEKWPEWFPRQELLTKIYRQENAEFVALLQRARMGELTQEDEDLLNTRHSSAERDALYVAYTNAVVDRRNKNCMQKLLDRKGETIMVGGSEVLLDGKIYTFERTTDYVRTECSQEEFDKWVNEMDQGITQPKVELCIGAEVFLTKNMSVDMKLVNGSLGVIKSITNNSVVVYFKHGREQIIKPTAWSMPDHEPCTWTNIPLRTAWGITIHKCQGMTTSDVMINPASTYSPPGLVRLVLVLCSSC